MRRASFILSVMLAVGIISYMLYQMWDDLPVLLGYVSWVSLLLATGFCMGSWILRGLRYKYILASLAIEVSLLFSTATICISQFVNMVVPARLGDITRAFILNEHKQVIISRGLSSVVIEHIFDFTTIVVIGILSFRLITGLPQWVKMAVMGAFFFVVIMVSIVFLAQGASSENRIFAFIIRVIEDVRLSARSLSYAFIFIMTSVAMWTFDIFICYVIFVMFGQPFTLTSFCVVSLSIAIGNLIKAFPFTPGGIGTYEAALAFIFSFAGVPVEIAMAIAMGDHLLKNIVTGILGGISMVVMGGNLFSNIKSMLVSQNSG